MSGVVLKKSLLLLTLLQAEPQQWFLQPTRDPGLQTGQRNPLLLQISIAL